MRLSGGTAVTANGLTGNLYASNVRSATGRPAYVLLHGIGVSHRYLARLHLELARGTNRRNVQADAGAAAVYSFDLPGFGGTPRPARPVTVG